MSITMDFNDPQLPNILQIVGITEEWNLQREILRELTSLRKDTFERQKKNLEQQAQSTSDTQSQYHIETQIEELGEYHYEAENIVLCNLFTGAFALFELSLKHLCMREYDRRSDPRPEVKKSQSIMEQAKGWLNTLNVGFSANNAEWDTLTKYRTIRNLIVHNGGVIESDEDQNIVRFAQQKGIILDISAPADIHLPKGFCEVALVDFENFLHSILQMIVSASTST